MKINVLSILSLLTMIGLSILIEGTDEGLWRKTLLVLLTLAAIVFGRTSGITDKIAALIDRATGHGPKL